LLKRKHRIMIQEMLGQDLEGRSEFLQDGMNVQCIISGDVYHVEGHWMEVHVDSHGYPTGKPDYRVFNLRNLNTGKTFGCAENIVARDYKVI